METLILSNNSLAASALILLSIFSLKKLKHLSLENCSLGEKGATLLAKNLSAASCSLVSINLKHNNLGDNANLSNFSFSNQLSSVLMNSNFETLFGSLCSAQPQIRYYQSFSQQTWRPNCHLFCKSSQQLQSQNCGSQLQFHHI